MTKATGTRPIRAITFDLDDTLWEIGPTLVRAEQRLHDWLSEHYPRITERYNNVQLRDLRHEIVKQNPKLAHDLTALRIEGLKHAAQQVGYKSSQFDHEAAFAVFFAGRNDVIFFPDAMPALETLAKRYPLVALTNGNADIHRTGLGHVMQFAISAADVGASKPDPAMFMTACERLGFAAEEVVHVGDDLALDVAGAAAVGMRTVWVNRKNADVADNERQLADMEITTLATLSGVLVNWEKE